MKSRALLFCIGFVAVAALLLFLMRPLHPWKDGKEPAPAETPGTSPTLRRSAYPVIPQSAEDRVAAARANCAAILSSLFQDAGVVYPADALFLRAFKKERELEIWGSNPGESFQLIAVYAWTESSGNPGPKRREGDAQIPEGFYEIDRYNSKSKYHLSLGLNYPNTADRILGDPDQPGTDIFIHGNQVSTGCIPLGDDRIEEVYLMTADSVSHPIPVHIFPARMHGRKWEQWKREQIALLPELATFWQQLQPVYDHFESTRQIPRVKTLENGAYAIE